MFTRLLAQTEYEEFGNGLIEAVVGLVFLALTLALVVLAIAGIWAVFRKADQPGWAAIIPIYNLVVLLRVAGRPWWWIFLLLIPVVNLVITILVSVDVANAFGKGAGFALGLAFLGFVFYPILGFGDARYVGPPAR